MKKKVAILVGELRSKDYYVDDLLLKKEMERRGHLVDIVYWASNSYDFKSSDLAIVRSCWDYHHNIERFLETLKTIASETKLVNAYDTILENHNKIYLKNLMDKGVPIIDSEFITHYDQLEEALMKIDSDTVVIKPSISASGMDTHRISIGDPKIKSLVETISKKSEVMIQPYIESIESTGEKSTILIDNEIVFTMKKKPAKDGFLVQKSYGGTSVPDKVDEKDKVFIQKIIDNLPQNTGYVRIDYMFDKDMKPLLSELELIEPCLYLETNTKGLTLLADYLEKNLNS